LHEAKEIDFQLVWARFLIDMAQVETTVKQLVDMLDKGTGIEGFELEQDMRWSIVIKSMRYAIPGALQRVETEEKRDTSDRGLRSATTARVSLPDAKVKAEAWERIKTDQTSSFHVIRAVMFGFYSWNQMELLAPYKDKFFEDVHGIFKDKTREFSGAYGVYLFPDDPEDESLITRTEQFLKTVNVDDEKPLERTLKDQLDDLKRSKACILFDLKE